MAAAAAPSPTPVPQNADAVWLANNGALELAREIGLGRAQTAEANAEGNYAYGRGQLTKAQPLKLTASRNQANAQGLAESGVLAQRQGNIQTDYASKQARLGEIRKKAVEAAATERANTLNTYNRGVGVEQASLEERAPKQLEANPPGEPQQPPGTLPGGVVPHQTPGKIGPKQTWVRVGGPVRRPAPNPYNAYETRNVRAGRIPGRLPRR